MPQAKAKAKASAAAKEDDSDDDEEKAPPAPKKRLDVDGTGSTSKDEKKVFVGGLPFACTEDQLRKDFSECGEIEELRMLKQDDGSCKGIAFITFKTQEGVDAALKYDGDDYGGRRLKVNMASDKGKGKGKDDKGKGDKGKGKGEKGEKGKGKGKGNDENTVFIGGLSFDVKEDVLRKDFEECGEIESLRMPMNEEGKPKGFAFIAFKAKEGVEKALAFDQTEYAGRNIYVKKAGEGKGDGKGKDGKGKDGKDGKGKGKDKGKGKKGKKGGLSEEKKAAKDGAMVASTGVKQTFGSDSEDDEKPPAKKAKVAAAQDSDDSE
eukprot:TRINITY_DN1680_c0_g1_i4.p2 TRINITY_DN1680_c0_g1~~TRINITY_DN1680_c0_g1_i4.p2  ORF type:complete len:321 (-),score=138.70 TRINITY_DN1680_c0_g1_i4:209-1171(-)